jgi:hypothetical protein
MGGYPVVGVSEKLLDVCHSFQFRTKTFQERLYQGRVALLYVIDYSLGIDAAIVSFHRLTTQKKKKPH